MTWLRVGGSRAVFWDAAMELRVLATVALAIILISRADSAEKGDDGNYESLFLTPYIKAGQIDLARKLSRVKLFEDLIGAETHSGYITTDSWKKSNLFFLHIRARKNPDAYPLLLWLQGGPGLSSLFGEFLEIGPLGIDDQGRLFQRRSSLQRHVNVVYLDQPVGAGYSFTKGLLGYAKDLNDVSSGVLTFLDQFITMFPEYANRTFYVGGESYGARFAVGVSHAIHVGKEPRVPLHLRGVILGAGFLGRLMKVADSSAFLYEMSLVTKKGRKSLAESFADMRRKVRTLIGKLAALLRLRKTIFTSEKKPTLFQKLTGFNNQASALYSERPMNMVQYEKYVQSDAFKRAVHIGRDVEFMKDEGKVATSLKNDYPDRHKPRDRGPAPIVQGALLHGSDGHALPVAESPGVLPVPRLDRRRGVPEGGAEALEGVSHVSFRIRSRDQGAKHDRRGALPSGTLHGRRRTRRGQQDDVELHRGQREGMGHS
ncbi:probable serine carboxypeptidase CPVL [Rhipicephalus sanguineus]|uniref:probable serine carboxypeptidase CPVL n=1 Tax=Rhipicephalus sanguineus TaxID=34632 RepID=UPI0020C584D9|nr:probable serine carboxypeptidase CPVL [Rhipicephalus sanguineus]